MSISTLPYLGGKSANNVNKLGQWISETIGPTERNEIWCDFFFGMGGVTLQRPAKRPPNGSEWANDADQAIIDWFRVVQSPILRAELIELLEYNPISSRAFFISARQILQNDPTYIWSWLEEKDSIVARAWATTYCLLKSLSGSIEQNMSWAFKQDNLAWIDMKMLDKLYERIKMIQFDCRDALVLLKRTSKMENVHIYCDPPYPNTTGYRMTVDQDELDTLLLQQSGRVAVSGFDGDRPRLELAGWRVEYRDRYTTFASGGQTTKKREALWLNYQPNNRLF